jgi:hypothetical protein
MRFLRNLVLLSLLANWSAQAVKIIEIDYNSDTQELTATIEYFGLEDQEFSLQVEANPEGVLIGDFVEAQRELAKAKREVKALDGAQANLTTEVVIFFPRREAPVFFRIDGIPALVEIVGTEKANDEEEVEVEAFGDDNDTGAHFHGAAQGSFNSW